MKNPEKIFELCEKTSKLFTLDYKQEYLDSFIKNEKEIGYLHFLDKDDFSHYNFKLKYEESLLLTSLLYCCSIVYIKREYKDEIPIDPFNNSFDKSIIESIISKANNLNTYKLQYEFAIHSRSKNLTTIHACKNYLKFSSFQVYKYLVYKNKDILKNLAYNFYLNPGSFSYSEFEDETKLNHKVSMNIVKENIKLASSLIIPALSRI